MLKKTFAYCIASLLACATAALCLIFIFSVYHVLSTAEPKVKAHTVAGDF